MLDNWCFALPWVFHTWISGFISNIMRCEGSTGTMPSDLAWEGEKNCWLEVRLLSWVMLGVGVSLTLMVIQSWSDVPEVGVDHHHRHHRPRHHHALGQSLLCCSSAVVTDNYKNKLARINSIYLAITQECSQLVWTIYVSHPNTGYKSVSVSSQIDRPSRVN